MVRVVTIAIAARHGRCWFSRRKWQRIGTGFLNIMGTIFSARAFLVQKGVLSVGCRASLYCVSLSFWAKVTQKGMRQRGRKQLQASASKCRQTRQTQPNAKVEMQAHADKRQPTLTPPFVAASYTPSTIPLAQSDPKLDHCKQTLLLSAT